MASKWLFTRFDGPYDYPSLGFTASNGDILDATSAPDAYWTLNGNQSAAETVRRHGTGADSGYVEPLDGRILTWNATTNQYEPKAPSITFAAEIATVTAARDAAVAVGTTNDGVIASRIGDPTSATSVLLSNTFRRARLKVKDLPRPMIPPHRGAGALLAPEHAIESYRIGAAMGFNIIDGGDWNVTADGVLVCNHDATWDRTTNRSGNVSDTSAMAAMNQTKVDASVWFGGNWADSNVMTAGEFFATFGDYITCPEPKSFAAATKLAAKVKELGLQESVIPNAFDPAWLQPFIDVGCTYTMLNLTAMPVPSTRAAYKAQGIKCIGLPFDGAMTPADALTLIGEGFEICVGTAQRAADLTTYQNWASIKSQVAMWSTDDPLYFMHGLDPANATRYRRTTDPFGMQTFYHGHLADIGASVGPAVRGVFRDGNAWGLNPGQNIFVLQGWACPLTSPTSYTLNFNMTFDAIGSDTNRWGGVFLGSPTDRGYRAVGDSWDNGYQAWFRATGQLNAQSTVNGALSGSVQSASSSGVKAPLILSAGLSAGVAVTSLPVTALPAALTAGLTFKLPTGQIVTVATGGAAAAATAVPVNSVTPSTAVASGASVPQTVPLRVVVTPTTVTFSRLDVAASVTVTDAQNRGPYLYFGQAGNGVGLAVSYSEVVIS